MIAANKTIDIASYHSADVKEPASVVAKAMLHNPLHLAVFGSASKNAEIIQTNMFHAVLKLPACNLFVVRYDDHVVGVMNYYEPGDCQIGPLRTLAMLPEMALVLRTKFPRVLKWKATWAKHDPALSHLHFGPLAVLPSMQGMGIGSALLAHFCAVADSRKAAAYLETDKEENVCLYERFGFRIIAEEMLLGVRNWFMWRLHF